MSGMTWILHTPQEPLDVMRVVFVNIVFRVAPQIEVQWVEVWGMGKPDVLCIGGDYPVAEHLYLV